MKETEIQDFWQNHPCGESLVQTKDRDFEAFFDRYDRFRYSSERHILKCLDEIDFKGKATLEIGLGQGADSEQIIRRGARWSGLDLTTESVARVRTRLSSRQLPFVDIKKGSVLNLPWPDQTFDIVFSHGVLHHVPEIQKAQREIHRVLKPQGQLIAMLYAKRSLNYLVSISIVRRLALLGACLLRLPARGLLKEHQENARRTGILYYLKMDHFIHKNTDGPLNPYSKVYDRYEVEKDFPLFEIERLHKEFMHAPPLPVHGLPGAGLMGWHLWVHMRPIFPEKHISKTPTLE